MARDTQAFAVSLGRAQSVQLSSGLDGRTLGLCLPDFGGLERDNSFRDVTS